MPDVADVTQGQGEGVIGSYTAVGDSFTEGVGDPGPDGAFAGWADRLAVLLADRHREFREGPGAAAAPGPDFRYANLAVRGRLLDRIVAEQVPRAIELRPDLVTFCAGGNDILRPGSDPDAIAERFEAAVADLVGAVGTVLVCTGFDTRGVPVLRHLRGKIATYTAHVRAVADRHGCPVLDLWSLRSVQDRRAWSEDRLHLSPEGHARVALRAAQVLGLGTPGDPDAPWPPQDRRPQSEVRRENIQWAREYLVPWIGRRLRGESSGDGVAPKRPDLLPLAGSRTRTG
ncbi:MAG: SGNH/GDSL hydrolase family protein [Streptomyces sp.]|nr:SGNH/GDSL hydrolase family protein [Streptomyces sp.]NUS16309.1 SGNH/GDSL hydrolase family protein [Streptomyces sp.]